VYSVPIDASARPVRLNPDGVDPIYEYHYRLNPDGRRVVFDAGARLFSVPTDGGAPAVQLNHLPFAGLVDISPDNERVVFTSVNTGVPTLYSVPIDGGRSAHGHGRRASGGPVQLTSSHVWSFQIGADGRRVVYSVRNAGFELYSVPSGGGASVRLNAALVAGGDVGLYEVSADGTRVVYIADQEQDGRFELYSVPSDASSPPVKLNGPLVDGGNVLPYNRGFELSADGTRVVYRADQETDGVDELYSVPIDGRFAPRQTQRAPRRRRVPRHGRLAPQPRQRARRLPHHAVPRRDPGAPQRAHRRPPTSARDHTAGTSAAATPRATRSSSRSARTAGASSISRIKTIAGRASSTARRSTGA